MGIMGDQCLRAAYGHRLKPWVEVSEKFKLASVADGAAVQAIALHCGTTRHIRSVTVSVGAQGNEWGADGYFQVHRHTEAPDDFDPDTSATFLKETYFNNSSIILFESANDATTLLYLYLNHAAGSDKDVHVTVEYYCKD